MKSLKKLLLGIITFIIVPFCTYAATGSITLSSTAKTLAVGSSFTVTVKVSCSEAIGAYKAGIVYDQSILSLTSTTSDYSTSIIGDGNGSNKSYSYTYKFKAIKSGTSSIKISSPSMTSWNDVATLFTPTTNEVSVTVKTQAEIEASYSKDNYLKSLTVSNYELSPSFDKEVTEYNVSVPDTVTEIKVSASPNDSKAHVSGTGTVSLSQGINKVEVLVTAENGSIKTYTLTVTVQDLNPIDVTIDGKKLSVVKKSELLSCPIGYEETTIKINDIEVPAFKSSLTGLSLVGLKDDDGSILLYSYDLETKVYEKYIDIKSASLSLYPLESEAPEGFSKTTITINQTSFNAFTNPKGIYIIYAMNIETGKKGYYQYDKEENTFIRYNEEIYNNMKKEIEEYKLYFYGILGLSGVLLLLIIALGCNNSKMKKNIKKLMTKSN